MRTGTDLIVGGEIILAGPVISDSMAAWMWDEDVYICPSMVRDALMAMDGEVVIRINSEGGYPVAGEAIRSIIAGHPGGVRMIVEGLAASAASLIFMGASTREMTEGSFLMIHNPSSYAWGEAEDLRREAAVLDKMTLTYAGVYARASGNSVDEILAMMAATTWLTADEAVEGGFATASAAVEAEAVTLPDAQARMMASMGALRTLLASRKTDARTRSTPANGGSLAQMAVQMEAVMPDTTPTPANPVAVTPAVTMVAVPPDPVAAERARVMQITTAAQPFIDSGRLMAAEIAALVADGTSADLAMGRMMATMAAREPAGGRSPVGRGLDETETRRQGMEDALTMRLSRPVTGAQPTEPARAFMQHSLVEMAAARLGQSRVPGNFGQREDMIRMAFHSTSDFPALFENALNRALAQRYALAQPTYRRIARQRSYADFRAHTTVRVGDFPELKPVNPEGGEIKAGTFSEAKETTKVEAYGVLVKLSRAMLVNDNLDGITQVLNDRGNAVARFEDKVFYAMMLGGTLADGPTLLETTRQVFNTTDGTKAAAAAAITVVSLSAGRAAMRKQKTKDGAELELAASILLVGPDKETEAQQIVAPIQAQQAGNVNPFSGTLSVVTTAKIIGNGWYLFADPGDAPVFEWGLLDGYTAPRFRMEDLFGVDGTALSLQHDFGCGAIDFRGGYKNAGA